MRRIVLIGSTLAIAAALALFFSDHLNRIAIFYPIGFRDQGTAFSVKIGDERRLALRSLRNDARLTYYESFSGDHCLTRRFQKQMEIDVFADNSWRRGSICIVSTEGIVREIVWDYNFLAP